MEKGKKTRRETKTEKREETEILTENENVTGKGKKAEIKSRRKEEINTKLN